MMTIGQMLYQWLTKLEWFSTLFPRIPVPIQKQIETKINNYCREHNVSFANTSQPAQNEPEKRGHERRERSIERKRGGRDRSKERQYNRSDDRYDARRAAYRSGSKERDRERDRDRDRDREYRRER